MSLQKFSATLHKATKIQRLKKNVYNKTLLNNVYFKKLLCIVNILYVFPLLKQLLQSVREEMPINPSTSSQVWAAIFCGWAHDCGDSSD